MRVPSKNPGAYARGWWSTAERGGAPVKKSKGYDVLPLQGGSVVAVGVRGCSHDPDQRVGPDGRAVPGRRGLRLGLTG